jgi:prepilin-type N-terminal cleavage/methylation domain-containing protein
VLTESDKNEYEILLSGVFICSDRPLRRVKLWRFNALRIKIIFMHKCFRTASSKELEDGIDAGFLWKRNKMISHHIVKTGDDGFSIVELCIVMAVACILMGFAILNMTAMQHGIDANKSMYQIVDILRNGRELAMAQRRRIEVQFQNDRQVNLIRYNLPNGTSNLSNTILMDGSAFRVFDLPDTPDELGNTEPLSFQDTDAYFFLPDGTFVGDDDNPRSGTIFLGQAQKPETARAVTIIGTTGRIRAYRWNGSDWIQ